MSIDWTSRARQLNVDARSFIDGRRRSGGGGNPIQKRAPRDGRVLWEVESAGPSEVDDAVRNAREAFEDGRWSRLPNQSRKDALYRLTALIEKHREELAIMECVEVGKPITDALTFDVPMAGAIIRACAEASDHFYGPVFGADAASLSYQLRRPFGVIAGIVGWNFPIVLAATKIAPVLATGNSLVLKPSELTALSAARLAELAIEAGIPTGVLNVIQGGTALGVALSRHGDVDLLTFTGSSNTGKLLMVAAGQSNMKRLVLECGGKAPNIVFDDCPKIEEVAEAVVSRAFWNQGEVCTASSRLLVQAGIKDEFLRIVLKKASTLQPGDPLREATKLGALVSHGHLEKTLGYIDIGKQAGARLSYQGSGPSPCEGGYYLSPVIFDDVSPMHRIAREEIFGPVLSVIAFRDEQDAIRIANDTIYGLSAIAWTKDLGRAHRMAQAVKAGWFVVNATGKPLGGPGVGVVSVGGQKQSGIDMEGGVAGLEAYVTKTAVQYFV